MREITFRDGRRVVQDHLADFIDPDNAYLVTYEEAVRKVNERFLVQRLNDAQNDAVRQHFARYPKKD